MQPINLFGTGLNADSSVLASETRLNCYYEMRQSDTGTTIAVRGSPGSWQIQTGVIGGSINGLWAVNDVLYITAVGGFYSTDLDGNTVFLAPGQWGYPYTDFADNDFQIMFGPDSNGFYYIFTIATGVLTQITDVNFPPNQATPQYVHSLTYMSGRFIVSVADSRQAYCSAALDGLNWTYLGLPMFFTKEQASDALYAVSAYSGVLTLFGKDTVEFWQDAGLSPVPFQYITGTAQSYGMHSRYSINHVNGSTYFLGHGGQGGWSVYAINGYTIKKVSTTDIDDILADWYSKGASFSFTHGIVYNAHGHDFYMLNDLGNGTLTLDTATGIWSTSSSINSPTAGHMAVSCTLFKGVTVWRGDDAYLYVFDQNTNTDNSGRITRQVTTKHIRSGGNEFSITELMLQMDIGSIPLTQDYHITLEVSRDGGRTFGSPRPRTLGLTGQYRDPQVKWQRLGSARDFVLRFTMTDNIPFVIASAEIETSVNQ